MKKIGETTTRKFIQQQEEPIPLSKVCKVSSNKRWLFKVFKAVIFKVLKVLGSCITPGYSSVSSPFSKIAKLTTLRLSVAYKNKYNLKWTPPILNSGLVWIQTKSYMNRCPYKLKTISWTKSFTLGRPQSCGQFQIKSIVIKNHWMKSD